MDAVRGVFALQELPSSFEKELHDEGGAAVLFLLQQAVSVSTTSTEATPSATVAISATRHINHVNEKFKRYVDEAYDRAWERLHCGSWKSIHRVWRQAFGYASVFKAQYLACDHLFKESLKALDMCLMMAGPYAVPQVHKMIAVVEQAVKQEDEKEELDASNPAKRRRVEPAEEGPSHLAAASVPSIQFPIQRVHLPSLQEFYTTFMKTDTPVILTGAMDLWPAMGNDGSASRSWHVLQYFRQVAGHRTVPIEVGSSYLEDDWGQKLMTMNEFIDRFLEPQGDSSSPNGNDSRTVGYLAQHHLFEQIPVLGRDIMTPDYCTLERSEDNTDDHDHDDDVAVNAWFGPAGTVSPLHFDPKDNLLCQVVGKKYLRLYAPSESSKLYPVEGLLRNTSQVRVESPDLTEFPLFAHAEYMECVLHEGEMLYIPPRYWHFVRSLSTSFSVSFWWS